MKVTPEIAAILNAKLDRKNVKTRSQAGQDLSYVDGHYVITKLNDAFGNCGWSTKIVRLEPVCAELDDKGRHRVSYLCHLRLSAGNSVLGPDFGTEDTGTGHGIDKSAGHAHESASKEAVTDALKRCARQLGPVMGLALYDKEQNDVSDGPTIEHGAQAGKPLSAFTPEQLTGYLNKYSEVVSDKHRAELQAVIGGK